MKQVTSGTIPEKSDIKQEIRDNKQETCDMKQEARREIKKRSNI
jgi:hypothetical protein